eukprot:Clim_evm13s8 gene=Clim_evmTU13s8
MVRKAPSKNSAMVGMAQLGARFVAGRAAQLGRRLTGKADPAAHARYFPAQKSPMLREGSMQGKFALVTGGGTGLGRAMATQLSRAGAIVAITSRKLPVIEKTAAEISSDTGNRVFAIPCDVRDLAGVKNLADECESQGGMLPNIIINNAAGNFISPTERLSPNAFGTIIDIVLKGTLNTTIEFGKRLIEHEQGCAFLSISTTYASRGSGFVVPSACAKSGVEAMTKSLSAEWSRYGMRFNAIAPGPIRTKGAFDRLDPSGQFENTLKTRIATGRLGEPEELANLACYMVSDYSNWLSGEVITLDGGECVTIGGEFNPLLEITHPEWDAMEAMIRGVNKKGS